MNLKQLEHFIAAAERLHFAQASEALGISQPALTRSIQALEKELDFPLFIRNNKWNVRLTGAGKIYLEEAKRLLRQSECAKRVASAADSGKSGRMTIGAISSMLGQGFFIDALAEMQKKYPGAVVGIEDGPSGELLEKLSAQKLDLAFLRLPERKNDLPFVWEKLYCDTLLFAMSKKHPLAAGKKWKTSALRNESFILVPEKVSSTFRNYIINLCRRKGKFEPKIRQEISNSYAALNLAASGAGITMVSSAYKNYLPERLAYCVPEDFLPVLPMYAVFPDENKLPLAITFLEILKKAIRA